MLPHEVLNIIKSDSNTHFDSTVVDAFLAAFRRGAMEVSSVQL